MSKKLKRKKTVDDAELEVLDAVDDPPQKLIKPDFSKVVSTGSTLLDLAISGGIVRYGGVPGGIIVEVFGPSSTGKTAVLAEMAASAQSLGGDVKFLDPEARLNKEYVKIYGVSLEEEDYCRPDTVSDWFTEIESFEPRDDSGEIINVIAVDSIAAFTTDWEMESKDEYGMRKAKQIREGLRKTCRIIANNNWLVACSNQESEGPKGTTTAGGKGISYYASLRIRLTPGYPASKITKKKKVGKKDITKTVGIITKAEVRKSSEDDPYRIAPVYIVFGYGIDDIRANLQWYKDHTGSTKFQCIDKEIVSIEKAIKYIEDNGLEDDLKEAVVDLWNEVEDSFKMDRKSKVR